MAWSGIEAVSYFYQGHVKFQHYMVRKMDDFAPIWAIQDDKSNFTSQMAMK